MCRFWHSLAKGLGRLLAPIGFFVFTATLVLQPLLVSAQGWAPPPPGAAGPPVNFSGVYPRIEPAITRIVPGTVVRPNRSQRVLLFGANIAPGARVSLYNQTQGRTFTSIPTTYHGPSMISFRANLTGMNDLWTAQVINPNGTRSAPFSFNIAQASGTQPYMPLSPAEQDIYPQAPGSQAR